LLISELETHSAHSTINGWALSKKLRESGNKPCKNENYEY
jgi:hypothetical protein